MCLTRSETPYSYWAEIDGAKYSCELSTPFHLAIPFTEHYTRKHHCTWQPLQGAFASAIVATTNFAIIISLREAITGMHGIRLSRCQDKYFRKRESRSIRQRNRLDQFGVRMGSLLRRPRHMWRRFILAGAYVDESSCSFRYRLRWCAISYLSPEKFWLYLLHINWFRDSVYLIRWGMKSKMNQLRLSNNGISSCWSTWFFGLSFHYHCQFISSSFQFPFVL